MLPAWGLPSRPGFPLGNGKGESSNSSIARQGFLFTFCSGLEVADPHPRYTKSAEGAGRGALELIHSSGQINTGSLLYVSTGWGTVYAWLGVPFMRNFGVPFMRG